MEQSQTVQQDEWYPSTPSRSNSPSSESNFEMSTFEQNCSTNMKSPVSFSVEGINILGIESSLFHSAKALDSRLREHCRTATTHASEIHLPADDLQPPHPVDSSNTTATSILSRTSENQALLDSHARVITVVDQRAQQAADSRARAAFEEELLRAAVAQAALRAALEEIRVAAAEPGARGLPAGGPPGEAAAAVCEAVRALRRRAIDAEEMARLLFLRLQASISPLLSPVRSPLSRLASCCC
jgi:hypothetical protein